MDLESLSQELAKTEQGDLSLKDETTMLLRHFILDHPKDCRPGVMCLVDAIRIFAPEPPFPISDLSKVFRIVIDQLWLVHNEPAELSYVAEMMEKLDEVHGYLLLLEAPECILDDIFSTILEVFREPFDDSSAPQIRRLVVKMMISLLNETDDIPPTVLHRIFHHMTKVGTLRIIVRSVLRGLTERAVSQVNRFVQRELFLDDPSQDAAADVIRIYEAYKVNPNLVRCALPRLETELRALNPVRRIIATEHVGKMALLPNFDGFLPQYYPGVWKAYVERFEDVVDDVRQECTKRVYELVQNHPSSSSTEQILEHCGPRLLDTNKTVRLHMVTCMSDLGCNPQYIDRAKKFLPALFRRCRDKQREVRTVALTGSVDIYLAHRGEDFVSEVPSHVFASLFLYRGDKHADGIEEECAERLFEPTNIGEPACMFAFRGISGGQSDVAQNGLIFFSQTKTHARRAVQRLIDAREELLSIAPPPEASLALDHFSEFCPTMTKKAMMRFLAYSDGALWNSVSQWANARIRLTVAEAGQLWNTIVGHLNTIKAVKRELRHVIRLSGAHLFVCPDDIPRVMDNDITVNMLSLASPYSFTWHLPQLYALADGSLGALQRVAKYVETVDAFPVAVSELPQEFVDRLLTTIRDGHAEAVSCLVFAHISAQSKALKHLLDYVVTPSSSSGQEESSSAQEESAAKRPRNNSNVTVTYRLELATVLASCRFLRIDEAGRGKLKLLALAHVVEYPEHSWALLSELGCFAELVAYCHDDIGLLPMLLNAMTKDGVSPKTRDAIAIMGVMVRHPDRQQFLGDLNVLLWKTNWKPTFALVLLLSTFALKSDNGVKIRKAKALAMLVLLLQKIPNAELPVIIIGFIAALAQSVTEEAQMRSIATFLVRAYGDAKNDVQIALEACKKANKIQGLTVAANVVFECFVNALAKVL